MVDSSIFVLSDLIEGNIEGKITYFKSHRYIEEISYMSPIVISIVVVDVLLGGSDSVPFSLCSLQLLENLEIQGALLNCFFGTENYKKKHPVCFSFNEC